MKNQRFLGRGFLSIFRTIKCPIMYNLVHTDTLKRDISEGIFEIKLICGCEFYEREIFRCTSPSSVWTIRSAALFSESDPEVFQRVFKHRSRCKIPRHGWRTGSLGQRCDCSLLESCRTHFYPTPI